MDAAAAPLLLLPPGPAASPPPVADPVAPPAPPRHVIPSFTRLSAGVPRLDTLLGGGVPAGSAVLLYGPPFTGKQVLQQLAFVAAAVRGVPSTYVLHGIAADTLSRRLRALDPRFAAAEESGLVSYVDVHSHFLGEPATHPCVVPVEDPNDAIRLVKALEQRPAFASGPSFVAIQSASTLLVDAGMTRAFQFLRTLLGRVLRSGGVGSVCLQAGMHTETEVQMAKHLCAGMVELRKKGDVHALHVEGLETTVPRPGWIEYEFAPRSFRVTGSFAARVIH